MGSTVAPTRVVVAAVDNSPESEAAVHFLAQNFSKAGRLVVLMCAPERQGAYSSGVQMPPSAEQQRAVLEAVRQECVARFPEAQGAQVVACHGGSSESIGQAVLGAAQQLGATMLAIAPQARSASQRVLVGSVTDCVVRHSKMPVLVVHGMAESQGS